MNEGNADEPRPREPLFQCELRLVPDSHRRSRGLCRGLSAAIAILRRSGQRVSSKCRKKVVCSARAQVALNSIAFSQSPHARNSTRPHGVEAAGRSMMCE